MRNILLNILIPSCAFFTSSAKKSKEMEDLSNKYNKKCQTNTHIVRTVIFLDGRMQMMGNNKKKAEGQSDWQRGGGEIY